MDSKLICVVHFTRCRIAAPTRDNIEPTVMILIAEEVTRPFGPPREIISDNGICIKAAALWDYMTRHSIKWRTVMFYALISNGRAERMVRTLKYGIEKAIRDGPDWVEALHMCILGYLRPAGPTGVAPFELLYEDKPHFQGDEYIISPQTTYCEEISFETQSLAVVCAERVLDA